MSLLLFILEVKDLIELFVLDMNDTSHHVACGGEVCRYFSKGFVLIILRLGSGLI